MSFAQGNIVRQKAGNEGEVNIFNINYGDSRAYRDRVLRNDLKCGFSVVFINGNKSGIDLLCLQV